MIGKFLYRSCSVYTGQIFAKNFKFYSKNQHQNNQQFLFMLNNRFSNGNKPVMSHQLAQSKENTQFNEKILSIQSLKENADNNYESKEQTTDQIGKQDEFYNPLNAGIIRWIFGIVCSGIACTYLYFFYFDKWLIKKRKQSQFEFKNNQIISKYENKQFHIPKYYDKNNSTHQQMVQAYDQLTGRFICLLTGESGIGKTTSLQSFIIQKRSQLKKKNKYNQRICYIALGYSTGAVNFSQVQALLKAVHDKCKNNPNVLYTVFIDDINDIEKQIQKNKYRFEDKMASLNRYFIRNQFNVRICLISNSILFKQKLVFLPTFRKYWHTQINIKQKSQDQMKDCIVNLLKYYQNSKTKVLSNNQKQFIQYLLNQGHNLRFINRCLSNKFPERSKPNQEEQNKTQAMLKQSNSSESQQKQGGIINFVKQFEKKQQKTYNRFINAQTRQLAYQKIVLQTLANKQNKNKNCKQIKQIITEKIRQKQTQKEKQNISIPELDFLQILEESDILLKCYPRSEFIRKFFEKYVAE